MLDLGGVAPVRGVAARARSALPALGLRAENAGAPVGIDDATAACENMTALQVAAQLLEPFALPVKPRPLGSVRVTHLGAQRLSAIDDVLAGRHGARDSLGGRVMSGDRSDVEQRLAVRPVHVAHRSGLLGGALGAREVNGRPALLVPGPRLVGDAVPDDVASERFARHEAFRNTLDIGASLLRDRARAGGPLANCSLAHADALCKRGLAACVLDRFAERGDVHAGEY